MAEAKSRRFYPTELRLDPSGRRHLMVWQGAAGEAVIAEALAAAQGIDGIEGHCTPGSDLDAAIVVTAYRSATLLVENLARVLDQARMGLRVYAAGPESFVWSIDQLAMARGCGKGEVAMQVAGPAAGGVVCIHCKLVQEGIAGSRHVCAGCGRVLAVRDHFSRRLGGFLGVMADAG
jgi:predicted RNA-binding Zn-ribbon protein involved in translation (DUF1610 family)